MYILCYLLLEINSIVYRVSIILEIIEINSRVKDFAKKNSN